MSRDRTGYIATVSVKKEQDDSVVYAFTLDSNPAEELTVCYPHKAQQPAPSVGQSVMLALHPADSKWSTHCMSFITDVPLE